MPWLNSVQVLEVLLPKTVSQTVPEHDVLGHWWGVRHRAQETITQPQKFALPGEHRRIQFRSRVITHEYQMDTEGSPQRAYEVVLERRPIYDLSARFYPDLALLVEPGREPSMATQRLVTSSPAGVNNWVSPETGPTDINDALDFRLLVLSELATRQTASQPA